MSGPAELGIAAGVLVDAGLKASVVIGLGWSATRMLRAGSAAQRHAVWTATFATLPLLPLFAVQRGPGISIDAPWVVGLWAVGFVVALLPIVRGLVGLRILRAHATPDPAVRGLIHSDGVAGPLTWGLFRPVILLPSAASGWSESHRLAALAHERAHIARRDWAVHLAVWGVSALFWFHPLVWLARRDLAREAEHAADDAVLALGILPSDYAALLILLARPDTPRAALSIASSVGPRVRAVLGPRSRSARRWPTWTVAVALAALTLPALGTWPHVDHPRRLPHLSAPRTSAMNHPIPLLLALLAGCSLADADEATPIPVRTWDGLTLQELSRVDVRGTVRSIEVILEDVQALSPQQRAEAAESLRVLSVTCPYTRASLQLPIALHRGVVDVDIDHIDGFVQRDWAYLWRGLTAHVAVLDALGVDLPQPTPGDYLYGKGDATMMVDRSTLGAAVDAVEATVPLVGGGVGPGRSDRRADRGGDRAARPAGCATSRATRRPSRTRSRDGATPCAGSSPSSPIPTPGRRSAP